MGSPCRRRCDRGGAIGSGSAPLDLAGDHPMILRRDRNEPRPVSPQQMRIDQARALVREHAGDPAVEARIVDVEAAVAAATADLDRLRDAIARLGPERSLRELKDALRARQRRPGSVSEDHIGTLRSRHEAINGLENRREALEAGIERTIADLEALAARCVSLSLTRSGSDPRPLHDELDRLRRDLAALEAAHDELGAL